LQVEQRALCGRNSTGDSLVVISIEDSLPVVEGAAVVFGSTPMLDWFAVPAIMLPTILVASLTIPATMLVAWSIAPLTSFRAVDAPGIAPLRIEEATVAPDSLAVGSSIASSSATLLATLVPPFSIAEATFAISPSRLPISGEISFSFGARRAGLV